MGRNLAKFLIDKTGEYNVTVDVSSFENWQPPASFRCPLIFCATAFHWLDVNIKYKKCHSLLADGGYLVLLWNDGLETNPIIEEAFKRLFRFHPEKTKTLNNKNSLIHMNDTRKREILDSGMFELVDFLHYRWFPSQSRETYIKGFFSQSSFLSLNQEQQSSLSYELNELFAGLGDEIKAEAYTSVFIAKKRKGSVCQN
jgi:hypothetical protein